ncbi:MAG: UDP-N-acetylmuramoyl-L-alanine--D-glutamate ligase [Phycisphaerae bacterium]
METLKGKRATVMGLGRFGGGLGAARWLCRQGAEVTISDQADADTLADSIRQLEGCDVTLHLGGHDADDFIHTDLVVVNPAVPPEHPMLQAASDAGVPTTTEINLFCRRCRGRVIGITGSVGKSTTTAMVGAILSTFQPTHVGGNIGGSLLGELEKIGPDDLVVLELSSFQLEYLPLIAFSPSVALVTNLLPNHLDRHGTMEGYGAAKKNIFAFQHRGDVLILNRDCEATRTWATEAPGRVETFDPTGGDEPFDLRVPGAHNQANAQAAWAIARHLGLRREQVAAELERFVGLAHRLQFVAEKQQVAWYNDSKCTTPAGSIVALHAFPRRTAVMILGGYDKNVSFAEMGKAVAENARAAVLIGQTADQIAAAIEISRDGPEPIVQHADDMEQAVRVAGQLAQPGDAVLLSPACASYDMFTNYEQRGKAFVQLVQQLDAAAI